MTAAAILVLATLPDRVRAEGLAESLVRDRLAACVSIGASIRSIYHWRGKVETADEVMLTIKTRRECYAAVETLADCDGALLVLGSSLTVMSGFRFVRAAAKLGVPVVIVNRGTTRADDLATVKLHAGTSEFATALAS